MRGRVRRRDQSKENTKGGNDKIGKKQGSSDISEKDWRGRPERDLTDKSIVVCFGEAWTPSTDDTKSS